MRVDVARLSPPRTATSSALSFTAPSSSVCRARPRKPCEETIRFATEINPHTIQVSPAAPYPGTFLHKQATDNGWFATDNAALVDALGGQIAQLSYPHLNHTEIFDSAGEFLQAVLFPRAEDRLPLSATLRSPQMMKRAACAKAWSSFQFLRQRRGGGLSR